MHNPTGVPMPIQDGNVTRIIMPGATVTLKNPRRIVESSEKRLDNPHESSRAESFGMVYANDLAKAEFDKKKPKFPVGAMIVRERNAAIDSRSPEVFIAMVKREKDFSRKTGDWEFLTFDANSNLQKRETKSDCSKCHGERKDTDWVFRSYPK